MSQRTLCTPPPSCPCGSSLPPQAERMQVVQGTTCALRVSPKPSSPHTLPLTRPATFAHVVKAAADENMPSRIFNMLLVAGALSGGAAWLKAHPESMHAIHMPKTVLFSALPPQSERAGEGAGDVCGETQHNSADPPIDMEYFFALA